MRRIWLVATFVGVLTLGVGAFVLPAGAGEVDLGATTFVVRKVVVGPATSGSAVVVQCSDSSETATLTFDKTGAPDTTTSNSFEKLNGAWVLNTSLPPEATACTFTETVSGGALNTAWICSYQSSPPEEEPALPEGIDDPLTPGCAAGSGTGTGPVTVVYGNLDDDVATQSSVVTFTNTYGDLPPAPPVNTAPNFTG